MLTTQAARDGRWLSRQCSRPRAHLRLVCVPYAGGGASAFQRWNGLLGDRVEVWTALLPGREQRFAEPAVAAMDPVAGPLAAAVEASVRPPFVLFGHSMGALVCYEVARALAAAGAAPRQLVVSASPPPHLKLAQDWDWHDDGQPGDPTLIDWLTRLGGVPAELLADRDLLELALPALRADLWLCRRYLGVPGRPALDLPISAIAGERDPVAPVASVAEWRAYTTARFELTVMAGGHFYLNDDLAAVPRLLQRLLAPGRPA